MAPTDDEPDFRLDGLEPANPAMGESFWDAVESESHEMSVLASHHSPDGRTSFFVLHDRTATWGIPGEPQLIALHLTRDTEARTFTADFVRLPLVSMAQSWLIKRGCPTDAIGLPEGMGSRPADETTVALERRLMGDGDNFAVLFSYTEDSGLKPEITVLLRALDEMAPYPYRVLLEELDTSTWTHTLREGGFETFEAADAWLEDRDAPLPATPALRASAARTSAVPTLPPAPAAGPRSGRSR
ncbi:hypothetical protein [Streptomyces sp. NBC_01439]|uniref:hypothetical protein n=1 Tax=Streptomyces sp. NBC_01439 TaxID=2903867 RepID=UPI002E2AAC74|nr:hypothetical protein [Streptomyces sp. NBC_01439]